MVMFYFALFEGKGLYIDHEKKKYFTKWNVISRLFSPLHLKNRMSDQKKTPVVT